MRHGFAFALATAILLVVPIEAAARPPAQQASGLPRTPDAKPNLQGIWQVLNTANELPYRPEALSKKRQNFENRATADPDSKGYLLGVPRIMYMPFPFQIFQTPDYVGMTFEYGGAYRTIYTNGTPHLKGPLNFWMGDSRGHWEGDTLVVDVVHFTDETWFDRAGNFHSEGLHLVERFTLADPDHINYEVTIEDPAVFTRPWKMSMPLYRRKERNVQLLEYDPGLLSDQDQAERERKKTN